MASKKTAPEETVLKIVGFDPASTRNLGWAVLTLTHHGDHDVVEMDCKAGTFVMDQYDESWKALFPMFLAVDELLAEQQPDMVVVEKTSAFRGGFITGQVASSMGSILVACGKNEKAVEFVFPTHVKKVVSGKGNASKSEMKVAVKSELAKRGIANLKFDSEHSCDAMANILSFLKDQGILKD